MLAIDLLDVNVWLALIDENHQHHVRARHYWENESVSQLAFCRITMLGLLRLSTNHRVMNGQPLTALDAWQTYQNFCNLPEIVFLPEPIDIQAQFLVWSNLSTFPNHRWTDAYLAAFAHTIGARLVSFDSDYQHFQGLDFFHLQP